MEKHKHEEFERLNERVQSYSAIALATATIEQLVTTTRIPADVQAILARMTGQLWHWQFEDKVQGKANMSANEARRLPSIRFYDRYEDRLRAIESYYSNRPLVRSLLLSAGCNLAFIVWVMEGIEFSLNPGKPRAMTGDIAEVGWDTLADGLNHAVEASDSPSETLEWQREAIARVSSDPADHGTDYVGQPVARSHFFQTPPPEPPENSQPEPLEDPSIAYYALGLGDLDLVELDDADDLEAIINDYAAIAFATASIEQGISAVQSSPDVDTVLASLADALWDWQTSDKIRGREEMSQQEAMDQPSFGFYGQMEELQFLADEHEDDPKLSALLGDVMGGLDFIVWRMDALERCMNPGKPYAVSDTGDRRWQAFIDVLKWARRTSSDPDKTAEWQQQALLRLAVDRPGHPDREVVGEPVERKYFHAL